MRFKFNVQNVAVIITDANGNPLLDYSVSNYHLEGDLRSLVKTGLALRDEIKAQLEVKTD